MKNENKTEKISKNKEKKQVLVAQLSEKIQKAKALIFTNYQGLTHKQLEQLKKAVKTLEAELVVTKNTLLKRALEKSHGQTKSSFELPDSSFQNPTATLFAYQDPISPLKELAKTIKLFKLPIIKLGILDGKALTGDELLKIASLPTREVLVAQVVGQLKSPIYGLHRALSWNVQQLVITLKAIESKKTN